MTTREELETATRLANSTLDLALKAMTSARKGEILNAAADYRRFCQSLEKLYKALLPAIDAIEAATPEPVMYSGIRYSNYHQATFSECVRVWEAGWIRDSPEVFILNIQNATRALHDVPPEYKCTFSSEHISEYESEIAGKLAEAQPIRDPRELQIRMFKEHRAAIRQLEQKPEGRHQPTAEKPPETETPESPLEARDARIYELSHDIKVPWKTVCSIVKREFPDLSEIGSDEGARGAARRYAASKGLAAPPQRQRGRKPSHISEAGNSN